ncbi:MAG: glycosyltransferase family 2 protein [Microthrixaceae bacterium]
MRVSVVIPCYNSQRFLGRTLDSVLAQDLPPELDGQVEVVLVDDGGTDDLTRWAAARSDPRIRVVRQDNAGVSAARNLGIAQSRGELIAFCDSDDLWLPTTAADLVACIDRDPRIGLAYGWYDVIDAEDQPTGRVERCDWEGEVWERFVTRNPVAASGVMVRRAALDDVGVFAVNRDRFRIDVEDWELWIRIAARWRVGVVPRVVAHHRRHDDNSSSDVESLDAAYRNLLDVVFADVSPERAALRPVAAAHTDMVLAWQSLNDRQDARRAAQYLRRAVANDPTIRRGGEHARLQLAIASLRLGGPRGYRALRGVERGVRRVATRVRG